MSTTHFYGICLLAFAVADEKAWAEDARAVPVESSESVGDKDSGQPIETDADAYKVPEDGTAEELLQFIDDVRGMRPIGETRKEMLKNANRAQSAIVEAAEKILATKPTAEIRAQAVRAKLDALSRLSQYGQEDAEVKINKLAEELRAGDDAELAKQASSILLQLRARKLMMGNAEGADLLLAEVTKQLRASPDDMGTVRIALGIAQALEYSGKTDALALKAYHDFAKILAASSNPDVVKRAAKLEGVIRRLELIGKPIEISGTQLDGQPFDQQTLKGKVVLVDFWATWCGPCVAELPNVLDNYQKYHDKGFEVVGISLDQDRVALETFLKDREVPWVTLFEEPNETSEGNAMATKYGVMGIPTVILVGSDGNVVSLNARGEKLGELLEKLLGPAEEKSDVAADGNSDKKS